jgi:biotin carboxyl carrier protein
LNGWQEGADMAVVVHPLWAGYSGPNNAVELAKEWAARQGAGSVRLVDSFNLSRRMAWVRGNQAEFPACVVGESAPPATPPSVVVEKAIPRDVVPFQVFTGSLSANQYVKILPKVSGFVQTVNFTPGAMVKTGQTLFTLDRKPFEAQLDQAKADLAVKDANLQNATDERDRQERLAKEQATSEKDLLNARNAYRAAVAAVEAGKAAVESAQINLDYCTINSPIGGKVDVNSVEIGPGFAGNRQTADDGCFARPDLCELLATRIHRRPLCPASGPAEHNAIEHSGEDHHRHAGRLQVRRRAGLRVQYCCAGDRHNSRQGYGQEC